MYQTKQFWDLMLGESWSDRLYNSFIADNAEIHKNMQDIGKLYKTDFQIIPARSKIFKPFRECPVDDVRVIFIADSPHYKNMCTGLALANPEGTSLKNSTSDLQAFRDAIERSFPGYGEYLPSDLRFIANQGVLFLYSSLTNGTASHHRYWTPFISNTLRVITENGGIAVITMGANAGALIKYIGQDCLLITTTNPVYFNKDSPLEINFKTIDSYLNRLYGRSINWVMPF